MKLFCCVCGDDKPGSEINVMGEAFAVCGAACAYELGRKQAPIFRRCGRCLKLHLCDPTDRAAAIVVPPPPPPDPGQ